MPPGDTIYYDNSRVGDTLRQPAGQAAEEYHYRDEPKKKLSGDEMLLYLFVVCVAVFIFLRIFRATQPDFFRRRKLRRQAVKDIKENREQYDNWLSRYNQYYASLPPAEKERFMQRTVTFRNSKIFRFHSMKGEEYMKILISGAAVQLTFGFKNYLIEYFPVINVIRKEYRLPGEEAVYEGHVTGQSICISWNHFIDGYNDYTDSQNVGLHEMAHAISFDVFHGNGENNSPSLNRRFQEYVKEAAPVFKGLRQGRYNTLDDYAATNVEEFWAVAVESFFEDSVEFRKTMPDLYDALCDLLNQNPLQAEKIIDKKLAGFAS